MSHEQSPASFDERLLTYLRALLGDPTASFREPPVPVLGGFATLIYAFHLQGAPPEYSMRLIVRIFPGDESGRQAAAEGALQNALAEAGYPVPRVVHVGMDPAPLGGTFLIMHRIEGRTLLDAALGAPLTLPRAPGLFARTHAQLHAIDPLPVIQALQRADVPLRASGLDDLLDRIGREVESPGMERMRPAFAWLQGNRPAEVSTALLHLDFHPLNVLVEDGSVTGVIDWSGFLVGDPASDVATTTVLLTCGPLDVSPLLKWPMELVRRWFAWRYLAAYQRAHPIPKATLGYYRALRCYSAMVHVGLMRVARRTGAPAPAITYAWERPQQVARMTSVFQRASGVPLHLPPE